MVYLFGFKGLDVGKEKYQNKSWLVQSESYINRGVLCMPLCLLRLNITLIEDYFVSETREQLW